MEKLSGHRKRLKDSLAHKQPDRIPIDLGSTSVTGIHVLAIDKLRDFYGLEKRPVKLIEPYQMLGEIENDLADILHLDVTGILASNTLFGFPNENWKEFRTHWGQVLLVPGMFNTIKDENGDRLVFWGGGIDTQKVLPFGKPSDVENQVIELCEIFSKDGGFVFNPIHNVQANVPVENIAAIFKALDKFNSN